jgi:hypothetical protein
MSMSSVSASNNPVPSDPGLAPFQTVVTTDVWTALLGILNGTPVSQTGPIMRQGAELRAEYRAHLEASHLTCQDHPGLRHVVESLDRVGDDAELHLHNVRMASGRVVLVSDCDGRPIGAVAPRKRAA